jgi:hypothetical protein
MSQTPFERLNDVLSLAAAGRSNAAKAKWAELPEEFRVKVLRFAVFAQQHPRDLDFTAHMESPWGAFTLDNEFLGRLPLIANVAA